MKSCTKIAVLSIVIIVSLVFIIYENKIFNGSKSAKSQYNKVYTEYLEANITENYLKNIENVTNDNYIRLVEPRQWVINNLIAHYSPRIIVKSKRRLIIEALAIYDHINQTSENVIRNVNFLVLFAQKDNKTEKLFHKIDEAVEIPTNINVSRFLWKLKCEIVVNTKLIDLNKTVILVTDVGEYKRLGRSVSEQDLNRLLTFQKPFIYDAKEKKKPAKGHCLHVNRNLDEQRLLELKNWLSNQQKVDNDRIKIYFSNVDEKRLNEISQFISVKKWEMKIEIIDFGFPSYEKTCESQLNLEKSNPKSVLINYMLNQCKEYFFTHMSNQLRGNETQESVFTNDCLGSFKYTHEFVTNYDFDEFILQRNFLPTFNLT